MKGLSNLSETHSLESFIDVFIRPSTSEKFSRRKIGDPLEAIIDLIRSLEKTPYISLFNYKFKYFEEVITSFSPIQIRLIEKNVKFNTLEESLRFRLNTMHITCLPEIIIISLNRILHKCAGEKNLKIDYDLQINQYQFKLYSIICRFKSKIAHCITYALAHN